MPECLLLPELPQNLSPNLYRDKEEKTNTTEFIKVVV